jgi:hypothetical protein
MVAPLVFCLIEPVPDMRQVIGRNTNAGIFNCKQYFVLPGLHANSDDAIFRSSNGVFKQIPDNPNFPHIL